MEAVVKSANGKTAEKREEKLENEKTAEAEKEDKLANDYSDHNHQASAVEDIEKLPIGKTDEVEEVVKLANGKTVEKREEKLTNANTDHQAASTRPSSHLLSLLIDRIDSNRSKAVSAIDLAYLSIRSLKCSTSYTKTDITKCEVVIVKAKHSLLKYPNLLKFVGTGENESSAKLNAFENFFESLEKFCLQA